MYKWIKFAFDFLHRLKTNVYRQDRDNSVKNTINIDVSDEILMVHDLTMNTTTHEVRRNGQVIQLTPAEYKLLHLFMRHPGQILDNPTIINQIWGFEILGKSNLVEVYVRYLQEKTENVSGSSRLLTYIEDTGYLLKGV